MERDVGRLTAVHALSGVRTSRRRAIEVDTESPMGTERQLKVSLQGWPQVGPRPGRIADSRLSLDPYNSWTAAEGTGVDRMAPRPVRPRPMPGTRSVEPKRV